MIIRSHTELDVYESQTVAHLLLITPALGLFFDKQLPVAGARIR